MCGASPFFAGVGRDMAQAAKPPCPRGTLIFDSTFANVYEDAVDATRVHKIYGAARDRDKRDVAATLKRDCVVAQFNHPHIVRVYEVFGCRACRGTHIVMERAATDVVHALGDDAKRPLVQKNALLLLRQLLSALVHVHECGYVHGDVTIRNVLLFGDALDTLKLCDFGACQELVGANSPCGREPLLLQFTMRTLGTWCCMP
jgi:serine/threonine protein kinase